MIVLVTIETIVLVLLSLLVAGLLRSHAEILRRLSPHDEPVGRPSMEPDLGVGMRDAATAPDIAGKTLEGESLKLAVAGGGTSSLIAFLSSGCSTCRQFWDAFQNDPQETLPGDARLIVVTKDSSHESPSKLRELAPQDVPVVMSSAAWDAYAVPMTPYFVYVDGATGQIAGEGTAEAWPQVRSLIRDALLDSDLAEARTGPSVNGGGGANGNGAGANGHKPDSTGRPALTVARSSRIDDELRAAGIGPDHPSLYGPGDPIES
ncbi:MAG: peroxiredoxin family protein [Actinomycetota bacterium]